MNVLFIGLTANDTMRGVERYCLEIARYLNRYPDVAIHLVAGSWQAYYRELEPLGIGVIVADCHNTIAARHAYLTTAIRQLSTHYDLVHYGNLAPYVLKNACPTVMTIHDLAEYFVPERYSFWQRYYRRLMGKSAARRIDHLVTVSHFSKDALIQTLQLPDDFIEVIYHGIEHFSLLQPESAAVSPWPYHDYLFYYGVIDRAKGIPEIIQAFQRSRWYASKKLILIGRSGTAFPQIQKAIDGCRILYLNFVTDYELQQFVRHADAVLYVSKYEGFGLPAVEAFVHNDHIIASNTNALKEVTQDFAIQVNPESIADIVAAIDQIYEHPKTYRPEEKQRILQKFSWARAAEQLYTLYTRLTQKWPIMLSGSDISA
jgi:glycosyltransferase involved in cell wall biosynthesis